MGVRLFARTEPEFIDFLIGTAEDPPHPAAHRRGRALRSPADRRHLEAIHAFRERMERTPSGGCTGLDHGRNITQVSRWLGHAKAAFTLDTYVHLMDGGLGEAGFVDEAVGALPTTV